MWAWFNCAVDSTVWFFLILNMLYTVYIASSLEYFSNLQWLSRGCLFNYFPPLCSICTLRLHYICIFKHEYIFKLQLKHPREFSLDVSMCNSPHCFFFYYCVTRWLTCLYRWNKSPGKATAASSLRWLGNNLTYTHFHPWPWILKNFQGSHFFPVHFSEQFVMWSKSLEIIMESLLRHWNLQAEQTCFFIREIMLNF